MNKQLPLLALLCGLSPLTHAEGEASLDEVVITATRIEQPLKESLASVTVITQEDIRNSQATDVPTILRNVGGVEVSQNGGTGKSAAIFLRGTNSTQSLILLDGVRINSATLGTASIENLLLDQIERIEIVRGNVSSVYGSEAIGGVVQIFTKRNHGKPSFNVSIGNGNLGTQRTSAGFGDKIDNTDFHLQVSKFVTNGVSSLNPAIRPAANPDNDGYDNTSASVNVRHQFNNDHGLTFTGFNSLAHNQYDSAYGVATDINNNDAQISKYSIATDDRLSEKWQSKTSLSQGTDFYQDFKNGVPVSSGSVYKTTNRQATWQNTVNMDGNKQLLLGVEHLSQLVFTDRPTAYLQDERQINSLFAGYSGKYEKHQIQANVRQDNNSQYGAANTGLLGYAYASSDSIRLSASYSSAFRAPSFNELYYPNYGNPDISPEKSRNMEAGIHYNADSQSLDLVYFDTRTNDLIQAVLVNPATYQYQAQNVSEARIDGVEFSYAGQFDNTSFKSIIIVQNPRDITNNKQLARRAITHGSMIATHQFGAMQIRAEWLYSDERPDANNMLGAYHVFNLGMGYLLNKETRLSIRAENLTDQNDSNVYGYNPLGRTIFASLSFQQ